MGTPNRGAECVPLLSAAIGLSPDNPQLHMQLAVVLLSLGDFQRGWAEYQWHFRLEPWASALSHLQIRIASVGC